MLALLGPRGERLGAGLCGTGAGGGGARGASLREASFLGFTGY